LAVEEVERVAGAVVVAAAVAAVVAVAGATAIARVDLAVALAVRVGQVERVAVLVAALSPQKRSGQGKAASLAIPSRW